MGGAISRARPGVIAAATLLAGACGRLELDPPFCGNGVLDIGEVCDLGPHNGDPPAFVVSQPGGTRIESRALVRSESASDFYAYSSQSAHTGLEELGEGRLFLYVDATTGRLSLVINQGIDLDATGIRQPPSNVDMDITGLPSGSFVELSDESSELTLTGPTAAAGRWMFDGNSDGGVIGGLPVPGDWRVTATADFRAGVTSWVWVDDQQQRSMLVMSEPVTIEPAHDGCAADCRSTR